MVDTKVRTVEFYPQIRLNPNGCLGKVIRVGFAISSSFFAFNQLPMTMFIPLSMLQPSVDKYIGIREELAVLIFVPGTVHA